MDNSGKSSGIMNDTLALHKSLKLEWENPKHNLVKIEKCLSQLKIYLTQISFLPIDMDEKIPQQDLIVARDVLEIGAFFSIEKGDIPSFERYLAQLKCYYFDYSPHLPESSYKYQLLGLKLLCLLSQNRVSEFHTELELLPIKEIQSNIYICHPVSLEQYLMEGSYNKILLSKGSVPSKYFTFFIDILLDTIREHIAGCIEMAFEKITEKEAMRMLFLNDKEALEMYASRRHWIYKNGEFNFAALGKRLDHSANKILPAKKVALQMLEYTRELEMII